MFLESWFLKDTCGFVHLNTKIVFSLTSLFMLQNVLFWLCVADPYQPFAGVSDSAGCRSRTICRMQ